MLLPLAVYFSYVLRLEGIEPASRWWPGMIALAVGGDGRDRHRVLRHNGVYARFWRYASVDELTLLIGAFTISTLVASLAVIALGYVCRARRCGFLARFRSSCCCWAWP